MNETFNNPLHKEVEEFSSYDWSQNSDFFFAHISLTIKRDDKGSWFIHHPSETEVFVDAILVPADIDFELNQYDHFIQIKNKESMSLLLFIPTKQIIKSIDELSGASIKAEKFTRVFTNRNKISGVEKLDFVIYPSEFVGIYGESGIGKSVLINSILGTIGDGNVEGKLKIETSLGERLPQDEISYLPQIVDIPQYLSCLEILLAAMRDRSPDGTSDIEKIKDALKRCSLDESIFSKKYKQISEGQKKRLCIAITLLKKHSSILIADEPTTGLDVFSEEQVMKTLRSISRSGITVLVVTHSVISAPIMDRVLVLGKKADNRGAMISYDGHVSLDQLDIISNALSEKHNKTELTSESNVYSFPYLPSFQARNKNFSLIKRLMLSLKLSVGQGRQWFSNIFRIIFRDWKSILVFAILAIVCALAIQFGTNSYNGNNPENILLTLFSLAAPWLCAMFAAISVSELNRYFAWEHFSGLRSDAFLAGTVFAHAVPAFCIALIFTLGLFVSPRNCEIAKKWICRGITKNTPVAKVSRRLWFVKDSINEPPVETSPTITEDLKIKLEENRDQKVKEILEDRLTYIDDCKDYATKTVEVSQWYTPVKRGDQNGLDKAIAYSPIMQLYNDSLKPSYYYDEGLERNVSEEIKGNYPLARDKGRELPKSIIYVFCVELLLMWLISWIGSMIGITSAVILGNAKNAAVSIIVIFVFYILFSRIFISNYAAMSYLQPLAEMPTNIQTIDFQDIGVIIPIKCSYVCLGRYASNILAYAFTGASLCYDMLALFCMTLVCLVLSLFFLNRKKMTK